MEEQKKSNHQVNIVRVDEILTHPNADKLSIIMVGGYQCIVQKDAFKVGDYGIYIQPDSVVPTTEPFRFIWEGSMCEDGTVPVRRRRITVRKFRKEWSEGLLLPLSDFPEYFNQSLATLGGMIGMGIPQPMMTIWTYVQNGQPVDAGDDVSDMLDITHYEPEEKGTGGYEYAPKRKRRLPRSFRGWMHYIFKFQWLRAAKRRLSGESTEVGVNAPRYDVEALKNHMDAFVDGEMVDITEKIHGCVTNSTKIKMSDGTSKFIRDVVVGDSVLSWNSTLERVIPSKVTHVYNNGKAKKWLTVKGLRTGLAGRGNYFFAVHCTPEHKFFVQEKNDFVETKHLNIGDTVFTLRTERDLTLLQHQVILGKLLGDGSLSTHKETSTLHYAHRMEDKEYVLWTQRALGHLSNPHTNNQLSGYGTLMTQGSSIGTYLIKKEFGCFYENGKKEVPFWVEYNLTPIALAFWYMDDGSLSHNSGQEDRASIATCGFDYKSCQILIKALSHLGIEGTIETNDYNRIVFNNYNAEKLFLLVAPYIPPCMQRKLPERYRGSEGWLPKENVKYKTDVIPVKITEITENLKVKSGRYDLETEEHNYFANNILVHNSNSRYMWLEDHMYAGSHNLWKAPDSKCIWRRVLEFEPWIVDWCKAHEGYTLYGEVTPTQKGFDYGSPDPQFFAFDIYTPDGKWIKPWALTYIETGYNLGEGIKKTVPFLGMIEFNLEEIKARFVDGNTETDGKHCREGVVVSAVDPTREARGVGRLQLKIVSNQFYERDQKNESLV